MQQTLSTSLSTLSIAGLSDDKARNDFGEDSESNREFSDSEFPLVSTPLCPTERRQTRHGTSSRVSGRFSRYLSATLGPLIDQKNCGGEHS